MKTIVNATRWLILSAATLPYETVLLAILLMILSATSALIRL
jgi:hypothetical protein